jgi:hypothetical protein
MTSGDSSVSRCNVVSPWRIQNDVNCESPIPKFIDCPPPETFGNSSSEEDESQGVVEMREKPVLRFTGCGSADDDSSVDSFAGDIDLDLIENN